MRLQYGQAPHTRPPLRLLGELKAPRLQSKGRNPPLCDPGEAMPSLGLSLNR